MVLEDAPTRWAWVHESRIKNLADAVLLEQVRSVGAVVGKVRGSVIVGVRLRPLASPAIVVGAIVGCKVLLVPIPAAVCSDSLGRPSRSFSFSPTQDEHHGEKEKGHEPTRE